MNELLDEKTNQTIGFLEVSPEQEALDYFSNSEPSHDVLPSPPPLNTVVSQPIETTPETEALNYFSLHHNDKPAPPAPTPVEVTPQDEAENYFNTFHRTIPLPEYDPTKETFSKPTIPDYAVKPPEIAPVETLGVNGIPGEGIP